LLLLESIPWLALPSVRSTLHGPPSSFYFLFHLQSYLSKFSFTAFFWINRQHSRATSFLKGKQDVFGLFGRKRWMEEKLSKVTTHFIFIGVVFACFLVDITFG
jgi:hypothetical protein